MKVLFTTEHFLPTRSGAVTAARLLAEELFINGVSVALCAPESPELQQWGHEHQIKTIGVPSMHLGMAYKHSVVRPSAGSRAVVRCAIEQYRPGIVHAHSPITLGSFALTYAQALNIPTVATLHLLPDNLIATLPHRLEVGKPVLRKLLWVMVRKRLGAPDLISAPTQHARKAFADIGIADPITVISNGVRIPTQLTLTDSIDRASTLLTGLYVGRLQREKNVDGLLRGFAVARRRLGSLRLRIVGDGPQRNAIDNLAKELGVSSDIQILGSLPDALLAAEYAAADFLVMPSKVELQCCVALEAMSYGKAVVAADAGALRETITHSSGLMAGKLCHPDDPESLGAVILAMDDEPMRLQWGSNAKMIATEHDIRKVVRMWLEIYETLVLA